MVVVGGGISALAAAHVLAGRHDVTVTVCEADDRLGGKVRTEDFAGTSLDLGPDSFLARRPEALDLCRDLGLAAELVAPATSSAHLWSRGRLRRLPPGLALGVPTRFGPLARSRVLSPVGVARVALEPLMPGRPLDHDEALGALVRRRLGGEVHRRLVDPLVGGINAGNTDRLSIDVAAPTLAAVARRHRSLVVGARRQAAAAEDPAHPEAGSGPVFLTLPGGLSRLVEVLAARLTDDGTDIRLGERITGLEPLAGGGYRVYAASGALDADAVVMAVPAFAAAPLLATHAPGAAAILAAVDYASVALVALAYPTSAVARRLDGSGFLVARGEGHLMTACSWASSKWAHLDTGDRVVLRVSAGRAGDARADSLDDDALVSRLRLELKVVLAISETPTDVRVARWPRAFPQYTPGHYRRIAAAEAELAVRLPGVALAGAALAGVGIPACIASGVRAAQSLRSLSH
ncbi:protoporphyrinogen oxidase [soil metagenome]